MKMILEILQYIETDYFWKEQMQFLAVTVDYAIKGLHDGAGIGFIG